MSPSLFILCYRSGLAVRVAVSVVEVRVIVAVMSGFDSVPSSIWSRGSTSSPLIGLGVST